MGLRGSSVGLSSLVASYMWLFFNFISATEEMNFKFCLILINLNLKLLLSSFVRKRMHLWSNLGI